MQVLESKDKESKDTHCVRFPPHASFPLSSAPSVYRAMVYGSAGCADGLCRPSCAACPLPLEVSALDQIGRVGADDQSDRLVALAEDGADKLCVDLLEAVNMNSE
jgi:hypothetical protein